jgi:penicillin V acylase-like amidase (Ntn superfamily)
MGHCEYDLREEIIMEHQGSMKSTVLSRLFFMPNRKMEGVLIRLAIPCLLTVLCSLLICPEAYSCTGIYIKDGHEYFCVRSFDWPIGDGLIFVNKKNTAKTAMTDFVTDQTPAAWTSKYGSVTINQVGCDLPNFGVNDTGLVVQGFVFNRAKYPETDARPIIGQTQWKQYMLDNCATVKDVLEACSKVRINNPTGNLGLHYMVCDANGDCAAIDFYDGKMFTHSGNTMPIKAFVDTSAYSDCLGYLKKHKGFGGEKLISKGNSGLDRFVRAATREKTFAQNTTDKLDYMFTILDDVQIPGRTKWQIVYASESNRIYYKTSINQRVRFVELNTIDFSCRSPIQAVDLEKVDQGIINGQLMPYQRSMNLALLNRINHVYRISEDIVKRIADYPDQFTCR